MFRCWTELLPVFLFRWLARRHCEHLPMGGVRVVNPRPGVFVEV